MDVLTKYHQYMNQSSHLIWEDPAFETMEQLPWTEIEIVKKIYQGTGSSNKRQMVNEENWLDIVDEKTKNSNGTKLKMPVLVNWYVFEEWSIGKRTFQTMEENHG